MNMPYIDRVISAESHLVVTRSASKMTHRRQVCTRLQRFIASTSKWQFISWRHSSTRSTYKCLAVATLVIGWK